MAAPPSQEVQEERLQASELGTGTQSVKELVNAHFW